MSNPIIYLKCQDKSQRGVVLFIALIALVVMSIAAVALIRSVDTNTTIAGNLSFQQSALVSADRGVESAITWVGSQITSNAVALNTHISGSGYFATYGNLGASPAIDLDNRTDLKADSTWNTFSAEASGAGITSGKEDDTQNTINYIIERMCSAEKEPDISGPGQKCLLGTSKEGGGSKGVKNSEQAGAKVDGAASPIYRVTVRVAGPKNTRSYGQVYIY